MGAESVSVAEALSHADTPEISIVIPILEYCCQLFNPQKAKDIQAIVAHATWCHSSRHSQEQRQLLSALLATFYWPLSRNTLHLILPLLPFSRPPLLCQIHSLSLLTKIRRDYCLFQIFFLSQFVMHSSQVPLCYQVTCLKTLIMNTSIYLILIRSSQNSEDFYCRNGVLAMNNISTASAPHQRCQHPTKGALLPAQTEPTRDSSGTSPYCRSQSPSHDLLSVTRPTPHKTVLGNLTICQHLASRSATPSEVTPHLALLLIDALLTTSSHLPGPVLPVISSGAIFHICHQASRA